MMHSRVNYKCFSFFCVWITLGVYSVKNRPKEKKERMRWGGGGSVFHSCMEFFFVEFPFFPFLLVDRRERAVSSLVYHYDEWPCCGLVTSPAELNQQTT